MLLQWKPEYSVGVPDVDQEHRELIASINALYARLGESPGRGDVEAALGEIYADISAHFALEETIMRKAQYAELAAHKQDHEALLDELRDIMDAFADDPLGGRSKLQHSLGGWFQQHFSTFDARLHGALGR